MTRRTRKTSKQEKGITLIALIVTIIILLILAGVTINMAVNDKGIFSKARTATSAYKKASEDEQTGLDAANKEIAKYIDPLKNTDRTIDNLKPLKDGGDGGDSNGDGVVDTNDDLRGFYIYLNNDENKDGNEDENEDEKLDTANVGVIFGDLLTGGKGVYWCRTTEGMYNDIDSLLASLTDKSDDEKKTFKEEYNSASGNNKNAMARVVGIKSDIAEVSKYTIPTKKESPLNTYEFITDADGNIEQFDGPFGKRGILKRTTAVKDGDRFYVMALADIEDKTYTWYANAFGKMDDYLTYTSTEFGKGKENTKRMIARGNNNGKDPNDSNNTSDYKALAEGDVWKAIQSVTSNNDSGSSSSSGSGSEEVPGEAATKSLVDKGWFVPSIDEWNAFGAFFKVGGDNSKKGINDDKTYTFTDYNDYNDVYKLSDWCWASGGSGVFSAFAVGFQEGDSSWYDTNRGSHVRLARTF